MAYCKNHTLIYDLKEEIQGMKTLILLCSIWYLSPSNAAVPQKLSQFPEGERLIYGRLVGAYQKGNLLEVIRERQLLAKHFSKSVYLDNAYYLSGVLQFQHNRFGEALRDLDVVTDKFPLSNKRPSALYAMAMTYKKLNLSSNSHRVLRKIMQEYPGSPESKQAWMQLRLEKQL